MLGSIHEIIQRSDSIRSPFANMINAAFHAIQKIQKGHFNV